MREIKFRAKNAGTPRCWVYGYFVIERGCCYIINDDGDFKVITDTQSQYTGLHDKNGKEIYEGDIVRTTFNYAENEIGVIQWSSNEFLAVTAENSALSNLRVTAQMFGSKGVEIIGNIYEDSHLLEKKNED